MFLRGFYIIFSNAQISAQGEGSYGVYVYSCGILFHISASGEEIWNLHVGEREWSRIAQMDKEVHLVSLEQGKVVVKTIIDGKVANTKQLNIQGNTAK